MVQKTCLRAVHPRPSRTLRIPTLPPSRRLVSVVHHATTSLIHPSCSHPSAVIFLLYKQPNFSATRLPKTVSWSHAPISLITSQRQGSTIPSGAGCWSNPARLYASSLALITITSVTAPLHHLPLLESHTRTSSYSRHYSFLCPR
jgi:hypothetical protein